MATRTQKAVTKKKAEAAKATATEPATAKATKRGAPKAAKSAKANAAKTASKKPTKGRVSAAKSTSEAQTRQPEPDLQIKPTLSERFWHRIGLSAQAKEERAHQQHVQHEAELERQVQADRVAQERAEEDARAVHRQHAAAERKANEKAAREMARLAREEDARLKRDAAEAQARAIEEKAAAHRAAAEEKAAKRQAAGDARREAAREAKLQAEAAEQSAAEAKAAKRQAAAEAKAAKRQAAAEAKAAKRQAAAEADREQAKVEASRREEDRARLEQEAIARRAPKVDVQLREKPAAVKDEPDGDANESEPVEDVKPKSGKGPTSEASSQVEAQADNVADELRRRRSKPITFDTEDDVAPTLPVGRRARQEDGPKEILQLDPAPPARTDVAAPRGLSIPEHFILLALTEGWDERREKVGAGGLGGGLTGALLLELVLAGKLRVQRDRFQLTEGSIDPAADAVADKLAQWPERPSLQAMAELAKWLPQLLPAYKDRMAARGLLEHRAWRHLGLFYRSQTELADVDAQERLSNKLARAIAGGGRPDAPTILSLGLLEASGLFGVVVPEGAQQYNRKRLNGLLAGKDVMGYKVDDELKGIQEIAVRTILDNVRLMK